jgi:chorismate-pyruvate lyase
MRASVCAALLLAIAMLHAQQRSSAVDAFTQVQTLNAQLLASRSATATLEAWCRDHHLADDPRIVAHVRSGVDRPPTAEQRQRLDVTGRDAVAYRRVDLECGARVLSRADNWYVPARLTPEMNRILQTTDTPFGKVVAALLPSRETFAVKLWWSDSTQPVTETLFEHRAVLYANDRRPFSEVDEMYQRALLETR